MWLPRLLIPPKKSFFLFGCRGSGKSTWIHKHFPEAKNFSLLDEGLFHSLLSQPGLFGAQLRALPTGTWVVIDEIQRIPTLLNEVHRAIEEHQHRFVLCGSSARKLRQAGVNLLAGRAFERHMYPFLPMELSEAFSLDEALTTGTIPIVWASEEKRETLQAYVQTYLREEIQAEALVRNLPGFVRFLPVAALFHGESINVTGIARDCGVARTTVESYLNILEETLLAFRISGFEAKLRVKERKHQKLYWVDAGLVRAARGMRGQPEGDEKGHLFEGFIATILKATQAYDSNFCDSISYWAPAESSQTEVDFLLQRGDEFLAIEVKSGTVFAEGWCKGLRAIAGLKGLQRRLIVYPRGPVQRTLDGIDVIPFSHFIEQLSNKVIWRSS